MLESSVVDRGFEPRYIQTKAYAISMWCFSAEHAAIAREQKLFDSESGECVRIERHATRTNRVALIIIISSDD